MGKGYTLTDSFKIMSKLDPKEINFDDFSLEFFKGSGPKNSL